MDTEGEADSNGESFSEEVEFPANDIDADEDDWAEFASHDTEPSQNETSDSGAMGFAGPSTSALKECFPERSISSLQNDHVSIPPRSQLQENFMNLIMQRNFARETSLPGRSTLWLDIMPTRNLLQAGAGDLSSTGFASRLSSSNRLNLELLAPVAFDLDLPSLASSPVSPLLSTSMHVISLPSSIVSDQPRDAKVSPMSSFHSLPLYYRPSSTTLPEQVPPSPHESPSPESGFAEDVAARGLAQLPLESLQEMQLEMREKTYRLSADLVSGLETRDRLLRSIKTQNQFVASLLQLQGALCEDLSRRNPDGGRSKARRDSSRQNKYLSTKLMYSGSASEMKPSTLERLTDIMAAMSRGADEVSTLVTRYLAMDVFETVPDDVASPLPTPDLASPASPDALNVGGDQNDS